MGGREGGNPTARAIHVHYATYLNFDPATASGNKIDPIIYWTQGVNPTPGASTGLTVLVTPVNDIDGNGVIGTGTLSGLTASENGAVVKEGESSFLRLGVNTPHTQPIVLRIGFTQPTPNLDIRGVGAVTVNSNNLADYGVAYVTLPATQNQGIPNTSGFIELVGLEDADNTTSESYSYTVTAGYFDAVGNFFAYGANVFTGTSGSLFVLDKDTPPIPANFANLPDAPLWDTVHEVIRNGTDQNNNAGASLAQSGDPDFVDFNGDSRNDNYAIHGTAAAETIHGRLGHDEIYGQGGGDALYGDEGNDRLHAYEFTPTNAPGTLLDGGSGDDDIFGGNGPDILSGGTDSDWLEGGEGKDFVRGDLGRDVLVGGNDDDHLIGGPDEDPGTVGDADAIQGGAGDDTIHGGAGDDVLDGGPGHDVIHGGQGKSATGSSLGSGFLLRSTSSIPGVVHRGPRLVPIGDDAALRWNETVKSYRRRNTPITKLPLAA